MSDLTYEVVVTHTETRKLPMISLKKELKFRRGQRDYQEGNPARSADGAYLDGYYNPGKRCFFVPEEAVFLVDKAEAMGMGESVNG